MPRGDAAGSGSGQHDRGTCASAGRAGSVVQEGAGAAPTLTHAETPKAKKQAMPEGFHELKIGDAAPDFDLTLSNDKGQPVLQRRYSAHQYLAGRAELASGIAAGAQIEISVRIDDARADAVGYLMRLVNQ